MDIDLILQHCTIGWEEQNIKLTNSFFLFSFHMPKIKPIVQEVFPFTKTKDAYAKLEGGHARGKIVVSMDPVDATGEEPSV